MKNINRAIWNAKMANRWAFLVRNARALVDRNVGTIACIACLPTISNRHTARP